MIPEELWKQISDAGPKLEDPFAYRNLKRVVATDFNVSGRRVLDTMDQHPMTPSAAVWTDILHEEGVDAVSGAGANVVMFCWPSYADPWSGRAPEAFTGSKVIYIGEGSGGCTGDERFHEILDTQFDEVKTIALPQWWGLHDRLMLYVRK